MQLFLLKSAAVLIIDYADELLVKQEFSAAV